MAAGAAGLYAHPNGNMSPPEASSAVDPHLSLHSGQTLEQELSAQLRNAADASMAPAQNHAPQHGLPIPHVGQVHTPVQQPSTPQQMAQNAMNMAQDPHYSQQDSNQRKRSKVSRACDECRRKKIRCDATSENGPEACTSCKRTGARCQFSRQPMKRGPSKGYIKELADRLSRLEYEQQQQIGHSPQNGQQHAHVPELQNYLQSMGDQGMAGLPDFSASPATQYGNERKRTHSMSEGPSDQFRTSLSQPPNGTQQSWDRREPFNTGYEHDPTAAFFEFGQNADVAVNEYYRVIQDTYPILPFDIRNLKGRLANCDVKLREAFTASMDCVVRAWPSTSLTMEANHQERCYKAYQLLTSLAAATVKPSGIILVQSYLLLAIEAEVHGPRRPQPVSMPDSSSLKKMCIGAAATMSLELRFHSLIYRQRGQEISPDSDDSLARRLYWILFILDQLQAISTSASPMLSVEGSHLTGDDETLFGPLTFALARLCKVIGGLPEYHRTLSDAPPAPNDILALYDPNSVITKFTKKSVLGRLETFSETLPADPHLLILLTYFHVRLLIVRFTPGSEPGEILHDASAIVTHLQRLSTLITSPNHHFAALAALTLGELAEKDDFREEALRNLGELEGVLSRNKIEGDLAWDVSIREYVSKKRSSVNESNGGSSTMLEHLAEAAVGERRDSASKSSENRPGSSNGGNADPPKDDISNAAAAAAAAATAAAALNQSLHFNPAALVRDGYLTVLEQVLSQQQPPQH